MNKFRDLQAAFLAKSFVTTAILFSLFAFSGHFATAEAQSGSWKLKEIKVFSKMTRFSEVTSEKYDKNGGNIEINTSGDALGLCPGGSERMRFTWSFEGDAATISNGGTITVNLRAGVLSVGKPCRLGSIGDFSTLSIYGGGGGKSPLSEGENKLVDADRFRRKDDKYYVNAAGGPAASTTSLGINAGPNLSQYPLAYFDFTVGTRAGDNIRYVYIYESVGSSGGGSTKNVSDNENNPNLQGNWECQYQPGDPWKSCSINQDGENLTFNNERGQSSSGKFESRTRVIATQWEGGLGATIQNHGNTIKWDNGSTWKRRQ
jgi:hypothetical protein